MNVNNDNFIRVGVDKVSHHKEPIIFSNIALDVTVNEYELVLSVRLRAQVS